MSTDNISFMVTTDNAGMVKEATLIGVGDGTPASGARIILGIASFFDAFEPGITKDERGKILRGLGFLSGSIPEKANYTHNNVSYQLMNSKVVGLWLIATPTT